tara:strand:- start:910 stop:1227 length:318 start_codon:yes stop_codon:yes gene_type:complete
MAFKMKGTPMLRNFGVSPLREEESIVNQTRVKADTGLVNTANAGNTTVAAIEYKAPDQTIEKEKEGPECNEECQERKRLKKEERRKNRENRKKARANRRSQRRNR